MMARYVGSRQSSMSPPTPGMPSFWGLLLLLLSHFSRVRLCRPHRGQSTRLPGPSDSPGKNTGVGCHFLLQCMKVKSESEVVQSCPTVSDPMDCSLPGFSVRRIFQARVLEWGATAFSDKLYYLSSNNYTDKGLGNPNLESVSQFYFLF